VEEEVAGCGKATAPQASGFRRQASGKTREASNEKAGQVPGLFMLHRGLTII
jgi:hypothetical protein